MKLEWKDYLGNRLIADHPAGFKVIKPKEDVEANRPLFCPICESMFLTLYDEEAWEKFQCCDYCANKWAYPHQTRWNEGWRPSKDDLNNKSIETPI